MFGRFLRAKFIWSSLEANIERRKHVPSGMIYCFAMLFVFAQTSFTSSLSWSSNCSLLTFLCFLLFRFFFFSVVSIWLSPARSSSRMFLFVLAIWGWNSVSGEVRRGAKRLAFWQFKYHLDRLSFSAKYGRKVGPFYKFWYLEIDDQPGQYEIQNGRPYSLKSAAIWRRFFYLHLTDQRSPTEAINTVCSNYRLSSLG